jgi:hypothetical protein
MNAKTLDGSEASPTSVGSKMLNLFASPRLAFDEVVNTRPNAWNWLVPTILVCAASVLAQEVTVTADHIAEVIRGLLNSGSINEIQATALSEHWHPISRLATCVAVFIGTMWSASGLWLIGRFLLRRRFAFVKALEVAGLTSTILVLGAVVTALLALAVGDPAAQPGLSLFFSKLDPAGPLRAISEILNLFHLWAASVLTIGLARLSSVTVFEAGFWVFGFWIVARIALVILS